MDHVVYLDSNSKELEKIQRGVKTHIIRAAVGPKIPYGKVNEDDVLYFTYDSGEGAIKYKAAVKSVYNSPKMTEEESEALIEEYSDQLRLSATQLRKVTGKKYIVLVEIKDLEKIETIVLDKNDYSHFMNWWLVGDIHNALML